MFGIDETLLVRALNATKQGYFPSYMGLRLLAAQLPRGTNSYLRRVVERRLAAGDKWAFKSFDHFKAAKSVAGVNVIDYRQCHAPAPLTAVAESAVLFKLASMASFATHPRAYSYLWPSSIKAGNSYAFFGEGYKLRNQDISTALQRPGAVAVVADIQSFYPSADRGQLMTELRRRLAQEDVGIDGAGIEAFYEQLLGVSKSGIPVGPNSAHVLGHLALTEVDAELGRDYGASYFRYVDDIVVVCQRNEIDGVKKKIKSSLGRQGFSLNVDKSVEMLADSWTLNVAQQDVKGHDDFRKFTHDLAIYLALNPKRKDDLAVRLADAGLRIPFSRIVSLATYHRFRYFLSRMVSLGRAAHTLKLQLTSAQDWVERGLRIKGQYENSLRDLLQYETPSEFRRWHVQRIKRVVNTLFYLRRFDEWNQATSMFEEVPELVEQRALATALASGTVNAVLPFFPRGPAAFAELWAEHGLGGAKVAPDAELGRLLSGDALCTLMLTGVLDGGAMRNQIQGEPGRLLKAVMAEAIDIRSEPDLSFEDEFESLRLGRSLESIADLSRVRYAQSEAEMFDALALSSEYRS